MQRNPELDVIEAAAGIVFPGALDYLPRHDSGALDLNKAQIAMDAMMATDAVYSQPPLVTAPNAGIPAFLTTYIDPKLIEILLTPLKSEEIYGSVKKGDWLTETAMFVTIEMTGEVSAYGDFAQGGRSSANANYPQRQSFLFQTFTEWGEREMERMGVGKVDWGARLNISSANTLNRFANAMNFYGVAGLQNYGGLNDPSLSAALTPTTKTAGGTSWSVALPTEILADIQKGFAQLQVQTGSNLDLDTPITVGLHSISELYLANTNSFGLTAAEMIKKVFPNMKFVNAVQYLSGTTYSYQMIVDSIEGQRTCESAFNEKMRAHRIVPAESSFRQKKTSGGWGTIIYRPMGIVSMAGI
jgi:hypothetical protein